MDPERAAAFATRAIRPTPRAVECPKGVKVEKGKKFDCDVIASDGAPATITLHITDDDGHVFVGEADLTPVPR